jgi:hypothetical protein
MSFSEELELLKVKIQRAEDEVATYLASSAYNPAEGKRLIDELGSARDEFIARLSDAGPEIADCGHWFTPTNFRHYASRILDGYIKH